MQFERLSIDGALLVKITPHADHRGFFARTFCAREFQDAGLPAEVVQANVSFNARRGTVRGLHFQRAPSREAKLVRCVRGRLFDVLLDLRPDSPSYLRHLSLQLDDENRDAVFIPHGVAHGFQTLTDGTEVLYQMTDFYAPDLAAGVRWNDPTFGINWPISQGIVISERDASYADFDRGAFERQAAEHLASRAAGSAGGKGPR
jgi:dTDP-4-dehydrorhamnose 3,5-epimerase